MFIYVSSESSQKFNMNDIFAELKTAAKNTYQSALYINSLQVSSNNSILMYGISSPTNDNANTRPDGENINSHNEKLNKNILIGNYGGQCQVLPELGSNNECNNIEQNASHICNMFEHLGGECFKKIEQSFLLFGWHSKKNQFHVAKDPLNPKSLYWAKLKGGIIVSTNIQLICALLDKPLLLSERGLASWLSGYPNPAISLFADIEVLPIGHRLEVASNGMVSEPQFWDIDPEHKIHYKKQSEYAEHFLDGLSDSVQKSCQTEGKTIVSQMSGGLDSTSITALAKGHVAESGKQLLPLSHLYKQSEKCDEEALIQDMLATLKIDNSLQMTVDEGKDRDFLTLYPSHIESPGTVLSPRYVRELALVKQAGADVLLTGNGGDEMCWGHSVAYTQRFKQGDWGVVNEVLKACPQLKLSRLKTFNQLFVKPCLPEILLKMLGRHAVNNSDTSIPVWLTAKAQDLALEETQVVNPFDKRQDPVGYNRYLSLKTTSTYNAMRSYDKLAENMGIDVRHPFFDTQVAEFSFAIPAKQLIQGVYPKWLLRYSMQHELPASVCWNVKKTTFDQHFGNLVRENAGELREILQNQRLADMGLVNQSLLLAEFDRVVTNPDVPVQVDLLYAILTYSWLNTHFPG